MPRTDAPQVFVEPAGCRAGSQSDHWFATWRLRNAGSRALEVVEAWAPHGRFRGERLAFNPPLSLSPGEDVSLELSVRCQEAPGSVVENAFLILAVQQRGRSWRLLARHRVVFEENQPPEHVCEVVTVQPVGFYGSKVQSPKSKVQGLSSKVRG